MSEFKVSMIGCGNVGTAAAYALLLEGLASELVLLDIDRGRAEGLTLDFDHSMSFLNPTKVFGTDDYKDTKDSDLVIITAGAKQQEGQTRLDLIGKNRAIFQKIIPEVVKNSPNCMILIVSNPVDVLTYETIKLSGFTANRVFGSGTMLDTARLRFHISEKIEINPKSINAYVLGEHGNSSFPVFSSADVAGTPLIGLENFSQKDADEAYELTKKAAYRIINDIGYTAYSIGVVVREITSAIFYDKQIATPLSVLLEDYYGLNEVCLSVPVILGREGVSSVIKLPLSDNEQAALNKSAEILKSFN